MAYGNTSMDQLLAVDFKTGKKSHTDLLSGTFVANCISRNGLEAERLALLVAKALRYHRKELQKAGFFYIGHQVQVGQESAAGSLVVGDSKEDFVNVPVIFPVHYQDFWQTTPEAETLEKIRVRLHTIATSYRGTLLYPDAIDSDGNVNEASAGVTVTVWETS